ncbi:hypothetical protein SK128_021198, partial [Halocaridina rubra]
VRFALCDYRSTMIVHGSTMIVKRLSRALFLCFLMGPFCFERLQNSPLQKRRISALDNRLTIILLFNSSQICSSISVMLPSALLCFKTCSLTFSFPLIELWKSLEFPLAFLVLKEERIHFE